MPRWGLSKFEDTILKQPELQSHTSVYYIQTGVMREKASRDIVSRNVLSFDTDPGPKCYVKAYILAIREKYNAWHIVINTCRRNKGLQC